MTRDEADVLDARMRVTFRFERMPDVDFKMPHPALNGAFVAGAIHVVVLSNLGV